jgi:hypothetical protein
MVGRYNILDNVHRSVQNGADSATDRTGKNIIGDLSPLGFCFGEQGANLENNTEVPGVPENVSPQRALQTVVQSKDALVCDRLLDDIQRPAIQGRRGLVLESNLDYWLLAVYCFNSCLLHRKSYTPREDMVGHTKLKWYNHKSLGGSSGSSSQDRQALVHLGDTESISIELAPRVICGELGGTLRRFHQDGSCDASIEPRCT